MTHRLPIVLSTLFLCVTLSGCVTTHAENKYPTPDIEPPRPLSLNKKPRVIVVLGSGAARGFAHAGVLKVLEENHIPIDMIIGTSVGSLVGALYADQPSANSLIDLLLSTDREDVIDFSLMNIPRGAVSGYQLQHYLRKHLNAKTFDQLKIPFLAIATELTTGQKHIFASGPIAPAVNASSAVPGVFKPVELYHKLYVDGGLVDPVAVDIAKQFHPQMIIAVNLNYHLIPEVSISGPDILMRSINIMMMQLNDYSVAKADITIQPDTGTDQDSMFDGSKRKELIQAGEKAAKLELPKIKAALRKHSIK